MIVNINYLDSKTGQFRGRNYSYLCDIPDIKPGDIVIAPTANGENEAIITKVDVPVSRIDAHIMPLLKTITQRKEEQIHVE